MIAIIVFIQLEMLTYLVEGSSPVNPKALLALLDTIGHHLVLRTRISACQLLSIGTQTPEIIKNNRKKISIIAFE